MAELAAMAAALLATGAVAGLIAGLLGVGGGIVVVPVLYHLFGALGVEEAARMHSAVGTSLATVLFTSIASTKRHLAKGAVDLALLKSWGPAIAIGVALGAIFGLGAGGRTLTAVFAIVAGLVALDMAFRPEGAIVGDSLPGSPGREGIGVLIGGFSVMMGIGGGTLSVPVLSAYAFPIRKAVASAAAIGLIIAIPGVVAAIWLGLNAPGRPPFSLGWINLLGVALIIPTSIWTAPIGADLAHRIEPRLLRRAFASFLGLSSLRMAWSLLA